MALEIGTWAKLLAAAKRAEIDEQCLRMLRWSTVAPAGAAYATLTLTANSGVVVFDNASLVEEAPPPPTRCGR